MSRLGNDNHLHNTVQCEKRKLVNSQQGLWTRGGSHLPSIFLQVLYHYSIQGEDFAHNTNTLPPPIFVDPPTALLTAVHGWRQKGWMEMGDWKCQSSNKLQCANALLYYYIFVWLDCRLELLSLFYCPIVLYDDATEIQNPDLLYTLFKLELLLLQLQPEERVIVYKFCKNFVNKRSIFP